MIKDSGISHTFLRNNWYVENELPIIGQALKLVNSFMLQEMEKQVGH